MTLFELRREATMAISRMEDTTNGRVAMPGLRVESPADAFVEAMEHATGEDILVLACRAIRRDLDASRPGWFWLTVRATARPACDTSRRRWKPVSCCGSRWPSGSATR